jgi:hypothetical protein
MDAYIRPVLRFPDSYFILVDMMPGNFVFPLHLKKDILMPGLWTTETLS